MAEIRFEIPTHFNSYKGLSTIAKSKQDVDHNPDLIFISV